jgi:4-hydroxybenzoate polyprenyltransferase
VAIVNRAKSKAYDMMIFVFGALMLAFALMGIDRAAVLLLVSSYLFIIGYSVYYRCKYDKEM